MNDNEAMMAVTIVQDDATGDWFVGKGQGRSFLSALDDAVRKL